MFKWLLAQGRNPMAENVEHYTVINIAAAALGNYRIKSIFNTEED